MYNAIIKKNPIKIRPESDPDFDSSEILVSNEISDGEEVKSDQEEKEENEQSIIEDETSCIWEWGIETNQVSFSRQWKTMLGYEDSEICNRLEEWTQRLHPDDLEMTLKAVERYLNGEVDLYSSEYRIKCKDGIYIWVLDEGKLIDSEENEKSLLIVGTHLNITQRRQRQTELEKLLKQLNCHNHVSRILANSELPIPELIPQIVQIIPPGMQFPYIAEASVVIYDQTFQTSDFEKSKYSLIQDIKLNDKIIGHIEVCYPAEQLPVTDQIFLIEEKDLLFSIAERIGKFIEKKETEAIIKQSEAKYRSLVETINEIIYEITNEGVIKYISPSVKKILGYEPEELVGANFLDIIHEDDKPIFIESLASHEIQSSSFNYRVKTKSGEIRWLKESVSFREEGQAISKVGTLTDITESKHAKDFENELLQLSPKLTGISLEKIDNTLNLTLNKIGRFLDVSRSYIFEFSSDEKLFSNTYEWCNEGALPEICNMQEIPVDAFPMLIKSLRNHENILVPSVADLPELWRSEREFFLSRSVKSLIIISMFTESKLVGFIGLDSIKDKKEYKVSEINVLKVWSSLIGSLINNKRIKKSLQLARKNYETFFNTIDEFVCVLDDKGNIINVNKTLTDRLKLSVKELVGQPFVVIYPPERREDASRMCEEMLAGITKTFAIPVMTKSGTQIPVETQVKHGFWDETPVMFAVSKDISQIMLSEQKFSTVFHSNPAMMAIVELATGKFVDVNNVLIENLDFSREEIIGKTGKDLNLFVKASLGNKVLKGIDEDHSIKKHEHLFRTKDGRIRTCILSTDHIYVGEKNCVLMVSIDITERKAAEEEIKKARINAELDSQSKSEFLSRMSYELRTPLSSILGFAQLLEMGELNNTQKKGVDRILHEAEKLLELINEVIDITRIDTGNVSFSIGPVRISHILPEIINTIQPFAREKEVSINVAPQVSLYSVKADWERLQQVLLNLITNVVKCHKTGGLVLLGAEIVSKQNDLKYVRISVTDTGTEIPKDDIQKLFKPFERIGTEPNESVGTNLGLAVVKKLVDAMNGNVGVENSLGEGSVFWIDLPYAENQEETEVK